MRNKFVPLCGRRQRRLIRKGGESREDAFRGAGLLFSMKRYFILLTGFMRGRNFRRRRVRRGNEMENEKNTTPEISIIMFTDFICEWCYLGKRVLDTLKDRYIFTVDYRFMEIHPDTPPHGMPFSRHLHFPERFFDRINQLGEPYGIKICCKDIFANTRNALLLAEYARTIGKLGPYMNLVWDKLMLEGVNISEPDILQNLVMGIGMNPGSVSEALESGIYAEALENNASLHELYGCDGVPSFIVNSEYRLKGAQSTDTWIRLFELIQNGESV